MQKAYEDYTQLFIGPNSLHAPPCESVYFRL
ncbi:MULTISPECIES: molecular chaperone TorD family protein [Bacillus amyloliquefaciens group]